MDRAGTGHGVDGRKEGLVMMVIVKTINNDSEQGLEFHNFSQLCIKNST